MVCVCVCLCGGAWNYSCYQDINLFTPPLARVHNINQNRMKDWVYGLVKLRFSFKSELE